MVACSCPPPCRAARPCAAVCDAVPARMHALTLASPVPPTPPSIPWRAQQMHKVRIVQVGAGGTLMRASARFACSVLSPLLIWHAIGLQPACNQQPQPNWQPHFMLY